MMEGNFRAFVALTFKELCRVWTLAQARVDRLPFAPDVVGSHWATDVQVDVVAIAWRGKRILLGEVKWGMGDVGRSVVRELIEEKTPRVLAALSDRGEGWTVHYAFFACTALRHAQDKQQWCSHWFHRSSQSGGSTAQCHPFDSPSTGLRTRLRTPPGEPGDPQS